ncbi:hypothetical protein X975_09508, partial [Stegodyphus mimosarum]
MSDTLKRKDSSPKEKDNLLKDLDILDTLLRDPTGSSHRQFSSFAEQFIEEAQCYGQSTDVDDARLQELVEGNRYATNQELAEELRR